jgi:hypothetical protein
MAQLAVHDDVIKAFQDVSKRPQKSTFFVAVLNESQSEFVLKTAGSKTATFDDFKSEMMTGSAYGVVDFKWKRDDGRNGTSIVAVNYNPDSGESQTKFILANNFMNFQSKVQPTNKSKQINDDADFTFEEFKDECE